MLPKRFSLFICLFIGLALISYLPTFATEEVIEGTANPNALPITAEEKAVLAKLTYPANMEASVYAREPMVQNPTAISMDESGRLFISETHRFDRGVEDNRRNIPWLIEDFAIQNTTERRSMYAKHAMRKGVGYFTKYDEKIRVIVDTDKDGRADKHEVFAEGFNDELDGTAAGVFAADGKVYFACIPNVWMLEDTDGDLKADKKESLQEGYGISVSISGHDLNGFKYGPDGRIYFSIGDRGYNLKTPDGRQLIQLNGGSVFRMEPDGSDLTEVHTGLRNPKEIAFDNYGNLFSVDNNADMKDLPRIVHVVEGGYSGWHRGHQHLHNFREEIGATDRHTSMWKTEGQWDISEVNRPAAVLPPVAHLSNGPSGLIFNPGIGLSEEWDEHFFVCDYKGGNSAVIGFKLGTKGAGFELVREENMFSGMLNTDIEFGYDGKVYVSDYVGSWPTYGYGSVLCFENKAHLSPETAELFANGFAGLKPAKLVELLGHQDQRARYRAQFELAKDSGNRGLLIEVAQSGASTIEKLHGTWGLGILLRRSGDTASGDALIELTSSEDAEVRGQAIKILGQQKVADAADAARELLKDDSAKTAMLAGIALGYLGDESDVPALLDLAVRAGDDAYLRHGAIEGLVGIGANDALLAASKHPEANARLAALIALRDLKHTGVESYLQDADDRIVVEAIQAINDGYIDTARLSLAAAVGHLGKFGTSIDNRILNAAYRLGDSENLLRVLAAAADGELAESIREEALFLIQNWAAPSDMDLTTGLYAPITGDREIESAKPQVEVTLLEIMANAEGAILAASMRAAQAFQVRPEAKLLAGMITNQEFPEDVRLAALAGLEAQSESGGQAKELLAESVEAVDFTDPSRQVAHASLKVLADQNADLAMERISSAVAKKGPKFLRSAQDAYAVLASIDHDGADELLTAKLAGLKKQPKELRLDIVESARLRSGLATQVAAYDSQFDPAKPIEAFVDAIHGGDPDKGRDVFFHHASSQCTQCHASEKGQVGGVAGPALMGIGSLHSAEYLLESLVDPSAALAPGYTPVSFELNSGEVVAGMLMEKTDAYVSVLNSETEEVDQFPVADIKAIPQAFSSMPPFGLILKKTEVRDLVAYLSGLKGKNKKKKPTH